MFFRLHLSFTVHGHEISSAKLPAVNTIQVVENVEGNSQACIKLGNIWNQV
jgi:hypothetical protein